MFKGNERVFWFQPMMAIKLNLVKIFITQKKIHSENGKKTVLVKWP